MKVLVCLQGDVLRQFVEVMLLIYRHDTMLCYTVKYLNHLEGAEQQAYPNTILYLHKAATPQMQPGVSNMRLPLV